MKYQHPQSCTCYIKRLKRIEVRLYSVQWFKSYRSASKLLFYIYCALLEITPMQGRKKRTVVPFQKMRYKACVFG